MSDAAVAEREPDTHNEHETSECAEGITPQPGLRSVFVEDELRVCDAGASFGMHQQSSFNVLQRTVPVRA